MKNNRIYLSPPSMSEVEKEYLNNAFDSNWIAPLGPHVDKFELEMAKYLNINQGAALNSGTSALHLALKIAGVKPNDKVLCSSLTFVASANVILYEKCQPIFIDSNPKTWTLDIEACEKAMKKYKPKALIAVDIYGQSCDYNELIYLCKKYNVFLIEDAAEALGSEYIGKKCGSFGDISILSFNGNKIITTSGGGMLLSNNEEYVKKAKFLSTQSRESTLHYEHKELGYNYRMSNVLAAIGRGQLKNLKGLIKSKQKIYKNYYEAFSRLDGISFLTSNKKYKSNNWLTVLKCDEKLTNTQISQIISSLEAENIESRPVWKPMHLQPLYNDCHYVRRGSKDISAKIYNTGICLPSGASLIKTDQNRIIKIIKSILNT